MKILKPGSSDNNNNDVIGYKICPFVPKVVLSFKMKGFVFGVQLGLWQTWTEIITCHIIVITELH